jgi:hypothetical protein
MFIRKTRARQDAERSLRDAGAPRGEISVPRKATFADPPHPPSQKPAPGEMPGAASGKQVLPGGDE